MVQPGRYLDLTQKTIRPEALCELGAEHLYRDHAMMFGVFGEIHHRHAACAEFALDAISVGQDNSEAFARLGHLSNLRHDRRHRRFRPACFHLAALELRLPAAYRASFTTHVSR